MKRLCIAALFVLGAWWPLNIFLVFDTVAYRDFGTFWVSGHAIRLGIDPYDVQAFKALGDQLLGTANYNWTYPPHTLLLFLPLSYLPPVVALILWNVGSQFLFWWAARPWVPKGMPSILALLTPAALINLNYGQTGLFCSALFLLAFRGSGLAAAVLTIKPHFGFLVLPAMMRDRRTFAIATIGTLALIAISALAFRNWPEFIEHARDVQGGSLTGLSQALWFVKGTTPAIGYGLWGWLPFALGGAYFLARNFNVFTAATATFLISPYGLHYDMAVVCLGFAILLYSRWDDLPVAHKIAAALAFLSPTLVVYITTWAIPPILLWGLMVQTKWTEGVRLHIGNSGNGLRGLKLECRPAFSG